MYSDRRQAERIYGKLNVKQWADLDNNKDSDEIEDRITYCNEQADALIDGLLAQSAYTTPFSDPVPTIISHMSALQTGISLYNGRRVVSDEAQDQVSAQQAEFDQYVARIQADTLKLPVTRNSTKPIKVVTDD